MKNTSSAARSIQSMTAVYEEARDLINIGAYVTGNNPEIDNAIRHVDSINSFLKQGINEKGHHGRGCGPDGRH
ncbi:MAG: hypothetical protein MZU91_02940 [Desulfosudis oleivorans]|nr:hypothetical protein [Desulfosudis oleivorans]